MEKRGGVTKVGKFAHAPVFPPRYFSFLGPWSSPYLDVFRILAFPTVLLNAPLSENPAQWQTDGH